MPSDNKWGPVAHGKVILLGEHAVVYGHKALAGAIDRGVRCRGLASDIARLRIPQWQIDVLASDAHPVAAAFAAILAAANSQPMDIEICADLPARAGLGSSAALCVAIARCVNPTGNITASASAGEACFHDAPSGIDIALSQRGGIGVYQKSTGLTAIDCPPISLVIALSGIPRSTAKMVTGVYHRMQQETAVQAAIQSIAHCTEEGVHALLKNDQTGLGQIMNRCHDALCTIGVSLPKLDTMVAIARDAGALGAKLTGAGGGGCIIALAPNNSEQISDALQSRGYECFTTILGDTSRDGEPT